MRSWSKEAARKKHINFDVAKLLEADDLRLKILRDAEEMRARQNAASDNIAKIQNAEERQKAIAEMKELKEKLLARVEELRKANDAWRELMLLVPNIPDVSVPEGESDGQNAEIKNGATFDFKAKGFEPKSHIELMQNWIWPTLKEGRKSRIQGIFSKKRRGAFVFCHLAIRPGIFYEERRIFADDSAVASSQRDDVRDRYLPQAKTTFTKPRTTTIWPDGRVFAMGYHSRRNFGQKELPKKYLGVSRRASRREAGSHGKDVKGLIRVHEFLSWNKLFCARPTIKNRSNGTSGSTGTRRNL